MIGYSAITDAGICPQNDDRVVLNEEVIASGHIEGTAKSSIIAAVCDGVGGHLHGNEAAEITARVFAASAGEILTKEKIEAAIADANMNVLAEQETDAEHGKMASTLAGIYISGNSFIAFNVGDSKVYRYRNSYLAQLSVDHTFAKESVEIGLVDSIDEVDENDRHKITRCIGHKNRCNPHIVVGENRVFGGDVFVICSDGLSDVVGALEIEEQLSTKKGLSEKCQKLFHLAMGNGSKDNISIILVEVATV